MITTNQNKPNQPKSDARSKSSEQGTSAAPSSKPSDELARTVIEQYNNLIGRIGKSSFDGERDITVDFLTKWNDKKRAEYPEKNAIYHILQDYDKILMPSVVAYNGSQGIILSQNIGKKPEDIKHSVGNKNPEEAKKLLDAAKKLEETLKGKYKKSAEVSLDFLVDTPEYRYQDTAFHTIKSYGNTLDAAVARAETRSVVPGTFPEPAYSAGQLLSGLKKQAKALKDGLDDLGTFPTFKAEVKEAAEQVEKLSNPNAVIGKLPTSSGQPTTPYAEIKRLLASAKTRTGQIPDDKVKATAPKIQQVSDTLERLTEKVSPELELANRVERNKPIIKNLSRYIEKDLIPFRNNNQEKFPNIKEMLKHIEEIKRTSDELQNMAVSTTTKDEYDKKLTSIYQWVKKTNELGQKLSPNDKVLQTETKKYMDALAGDNPGLAERAAMLEESTTKPKDFEKPGQNPPEMRIGKADIRALLEGEFFAALGASDDITERPERAGASPAKVSASNPRKPSTTGSGLV